MSEETKPSAGRAYIKKNYARFPLDLKPDILDKFKEVCAKNGTTPTTEIKRFISEYISANENN